MKYLFGLSIVTILTLFTLSTYAESELMFEDTFKSKSFIDTKVTTAHVDIEKNEVRLPRFPMPKSISMNNNGNSFAMVDGNGISVYTLDGSKQELIKNDAFASSGFSDDQSPVGIASDGDMYSYWVLTRKEEYTATGMNVKNEIVRYDYNGSAMSKNPFLSVTGLVDVVSISSSKSDKNKSLAALSRDENGQGTVDIYVKDNVDGLKKVPQLTVATGLENPTSVCMVPDTLDFIVTAGNSAIYYTYDNKTSAYVRNSGLSLSALYDITGVEAGENNNEYAVYGENGVDYYVYDPSTSIELDSSKMKRVAALSQPALKYTYSVALKQGAYEYATFSEDGDVNYWIYDQNPNSLGMKRNIGLETEGVEVLKKYLSRAVYQSTPFEFDSAPDAVRLECSTEIPALTSINWYFSFDDGATYDELKPDELLNGAKKPYPTKYRLRAVLSSPYGLEQVTPKIFFARIYAEDSMITKLECSALTKNLKTQILPFSDFTQPLKMKKGSQGVFKIYTRNFVKSITAIFDIDGTIVGEPLILNCQSDAELNSDNIWLTDLVIEPTIPKDARVGVLFKVESSRGRLLSETFRNIALIDSNVVYDLDLQMTK